MAVEPLEQLDLATRLGHAITSYEGSWKPVDSELYDLCVRLPSHYNFADVYTKVTIIGRVYEAGVARAGRGEGDPETEITKVLIEQADLLKSGLERLREQAFDRHTAAVITELHGRITKAISCQSGGILLASFVSKYLHFH